MIPVDLYFIIGDGSYNQAPLGRTLDSIPDVVEVTRDYVFGPLQQQYPALYPFAEFGLQAIESFAIAVTGAVDYTAKIGVADLREVPVLEREVAAKLAGSFVTGLHIRSGGRLERALTLLDTEYADSWSNASFTVEPGKWLTRHLLGESVPLPNALQA